jgi:hypothetical protein
MCEWSSFGDRGAGLTCAVEAAGGGVKSRRGICRERPLLLGKSVRRGVIGVVTSLRLMSSLEVRRDVSVMRGEGESLTGVPPLSDMDLLLAMGDLPAARAEASGAAC